MGRTFQGGGYSVAINEDRSTTTQFPGAGTILRSPLYRDLTWDDFRHSFLVVEGGISFFPGAYFRTGNPAELVWLLHSGMPAGVIVMAGANASLPGAAVAARLGIMYDRRYWGV